MILTILKLKGVIIVKTKLEIDSNYMEPQLIIRAATVDQQVQSILDFAEGKLKTDRFIGVKDGVNQLLKSEQLFSIYAEKGKVFVDTASDSYQVKQRLYEMEEQLSPLSFVRISKSEIVNLNKIDFFQVDITGTLVMVLENGKKSYVSRRYVKKIKERLGV